MLLLIPYENAYFFLVLYMQVFLCNIKDFYVFIFQQLLKENLSKMKILKVDSDTFQSLLFL